MSEYQRTTRECTLGNMQPELATALKTYIEKHDRADVTTSMLMSCETISTKQTKKLFRTTTEVIVSGVILTPKWLIWASGEGGGKVGVLSARLQNLKIEDYEQSNMYKMIPDSGLNVLGLASADGISSIFIGLGPEPASQKFRTMLREAMAQM